MNIGNLYNIQVIWSFWHGCLRRKRKTCCLSWFFELKIFTGRTFLYLFANFVSRFQ